MAPKLSPEITTQCLGPLLARLEDAGALSPALLRRMDLTDEQVGAPNLTCRLSDLLMLFELAEEKLQDPCIGLHLAEALPRGTYGLLEFATRSAADLRQAARRLVRYSALLNDVSRFSAEETDEGVAIHHVAHAHRGGLGRHGNEFTLGYLVRMGREFLGEERFRPRRFWFAHEKPADVKELERFFGGRSLTFGQPTTGMLFGSEMVDAPLRTADPALSRLIVEQSEQALGTEPGEDRFLARVRRHLRGELKHSPTLDSVARHLKMSNRTFQRRLTALGMSYQDLLDSVRQEAAQKLLDRPRLSLSDVAFELGYSELRPFTRAFKRWTGSTPRTYRGHPAEH